MFSILLQEEFFCENAPLYLLYIVAIHIAFDNTQSHARQDSLKKKKSQSDVL
jgi:hypothetical protein